MRCAPVRSRARFWSRDNTSLGSRWGWFRSDPGSPGTRGGKFARPLQHEVRVLLRHPFIAKVSFRKRSQVAILLWRKDSLDEAEFLVGFIKCNVVHGPCPHGVEDDDLVALAEEQVDEMAAQKAGSLCILQSTHRTNSTFCAVVHIHL